MNSGSDGTAASKHSRRKKKRRGIHPLFFTAIALAAALALAAFLIPRGDSGEAGGAEYRRTSLDSVLEDFVQLHGGRENIQNVTSIRSVGTYQEGETLQEFVIIKKRPDRIRVTYELPRTRIITGYNGSVAWRRVESKENFLSDDHVLNGEEAQRVIQDAAFDNALIRAAEDMTGFSFDGIVNFRGNEYYRIIVDSPGNNREKQILLDPETLHDEYLLVRDPVSGVLWETRNSDFRDVRGARIPFKVEKFRQGQRQWLITFDRVETNLGIPDSFFDPPAD